MKHIENWLDKTNEGPIVKGNMGKRQPTKRRHCSVDDEQRNIHQVTKLSRHLKEEVFFVLMFFFPSSYFFSLGPSTVSSTFGKRKEESVVG